MNRKVGIITFHRSHNCGSMLQAYALQHVVERLGYTVEIVNFSSEGQRNLYKPFQKGIDPKTIVKNLIAAIHLRRIKNNDAHYERFLSSNFNLGPSDYSRCNDLDDAAYDAVVCGSDQIWNITIADSDDAYFLPWVRSAKKIAYAVSFGARNILEYSDNPQRYADYIKSFDAVSTREYNGRVWLKELAGVDAPVVLDPTLLLGENDYKTIEDTNVRFPDRYIFYYSPNYKQDINKLVARISEQYNLPVIGFNSKAFYVKGMDRMGFTLPPYEDPSVYLTLMQHASLIITTSFHGTIFSTMYRKPFWTIKNGDMYGTDDRVITLMKELDLEDRLIPVEFDPSRNYLEEKDYTNYETLLPELQSASLRFLEEALKDHE